MEARQLDVEGREVPARAVGAPVPAPACRAVPPVPGPVVLGPPPELTPGQTSLDPVLGVDALFPIPWRADQ